MRKVKNLIFLLTLSILLIGCKSIAVNEIHNIAINAEINITELEDVLVMAAKKATPAVIGVSNYQRNLGINMVLTGTGSGVIYGCEAKMKNGSTVSNCETTINSNEVETYNYLVVTNRHVVKDSQMLKVYIGEERLKLPATLIQYDDKVDLAVIRFSHYKYIQPIPFADSDLISHNSFAIAIGNPSGYDFYGSTTFGVISSPKRYLSDDTDGDGRADWDAEYIQHDVAINPGNSGGALINIKGELIGINTLKLLSDEIDNMGFAIPSNVVKDIVKILETGAKPTRRTLGIGVVDIFVLLNPEDYPSLSYDYTVPNGILHGLYVSTVDANRPAHNKLKPGDIILEINGIKIYYTYQFRKELDSGEAVNLNVFRNNQMISVTITF